MIQSSFANCLSSPSFAYRMTSAEGFGFASCNILILHILMTH